MPDYKNGKIYKIVCYDTGEVYVGSTVRDMEDRLYEHKSSSNKCCSKQIIDRNNYYIEILETYPCNNEFELRRKEGEYQKSIECINHYIAGRTRKESCKNYDQVNKEKVSKMRHTYRQNNKETLRAHAKEYYQDNKEAIKARKSKVVICECGIKCTYRNLTRHKTSKRHIDLMANI